MQISKRGKVPEPISEGGGKGCRHGVKGWIVMKNEMSRRQFLGFAGSAAAVLGLGLVGCGGSAGSGSSASGDAAEVYFLQFKPEVDKEWKEIAKAYKKEKGVEVKIVTAASNTYEEKLKSEMSKSSAPTLFQVNGPTGLKNWKDYCADLSDTKLRGELIDDSLALQSDGKDLGIDWVQESYGIIYNKELLEKAGYKAEDINSFDKLKACADDIQARKDELGVDGAFTKWFKPEDLIGKKLGIVCNLAPRPMMKGKYVSEGMIFAADTADGGCSIPFYSDDTPVGARIH